MKKPRVFLVNLGHYTSAYPFTSPPMGILYLAAHLRKQLPVEIRLLNQRAEHCDDAEVVRQIADFEADIVGFSVMTTCSGALPELTRNVKQALPQARVIIGGPHASSFREALLRDVPADAVVVGEGELTFEAVCRAWTDGQNPDGIPGLIWRSPDGEIVVNPGEIPLIADLDRLPFPAYDLIDVTKYWKLHSLPPIPRRKYVALFSSRGCPYHCIWCHNVFGKRFRAHSAARIVDEIEYFGKAYGVKDIEFLDDIFNLDARRIASFNQDIHRRNLRIKFALSGGVRTDLLTQETVNDMADAGWYFGAFALETGSPRIQELSGKRLKIPEFLKGIELAAGRKVFVYGFAMFGHPTETEEELQQTIDTMAASKAHIASFFTVIPFPSTRLYDMAMKTAPDRLRALQYDGQTYGSFRINLSGVPDDVLFRYQRKAYRTFYLNPRRMLRIVRHYPKPHMLPAFLPVFLERATKGLFGPKEP